MAPWNQSCVEDLAVEMWNQPEIKAMYSTSSLNVMDQSDCFIRVVATLRFKLMPFIATANGGYCWAVSCQFCRTTVQNFPQTLNF